MTDILPVGLSKKSPRIAVLIPCLDEEAAIRSVVADFRGVLPEAKIYVYDNGSTDGTVAAAKEAGAIVRIESRRGKGNVVRRMFADVEADIYIMVDGDGTYASQAAPTMIRKLIDENIDMVVATRTEASSHQFRAGHKLGNQGFSKLIAALFGRQLTDVFSGYRAMSRRFVKSFPGYSSGFEIETELAIYALNLRIPMAEISAPFGLRVEGSVSKLSTTRDGMRILRVVFYYLKEIRPLIFFSSVAGVLALASLVLAYPVFITYLGTGLVPRFPTAILATGLMVLSFLSLACALILDSVAALRWEAKRNSYLQGRTLSEQ